MASVSDSSFVWLLRSQRRQLGRPDYGHGEAHSDPALPAYVWNLDRKLGSYRFVNHLGIDHPRILAVWDDPQQVSFEGLPRHFCIKPDHSASARGVCVVSSDQQGSFEDLLRDKLVTEQSIRSELAELCAQRRISRRVFAEEALVDRHMPSAVDDWKLYMFYGELGLVLQVHKRDGRRWWKFYASDMQALPPMREPERCDPSLQPPRMPEGLIRTARTISQAVPLPFLRVDLYEFGEKVVFGELTPTPGGDHLFPVAVDRSLGRLWERANVRLLSDLMEGKTFAALG